MPTRGTNDGRPTDPADAAQWRQFRAAAGITGRLGGTAAAITAGFATAVVAAWLGAGQEPRTVTVTSIVTSLVTVPTTTTAPPTTNTTRATTETTRATTTTRRPKPTSPPTTRRRATTTTEAPTGNCDSAYPDFCIPPPPPDLDCADIGVKDFTVRPPDPHGFDADGDGVGCES
jgi:hypothetical protein